MYKKTYDVGKPRHFFDLAINISDEFYKSKVLGSGTHLVPVQILLFEVNKNNIEK